MKVSRKIKFDPKIFISQPYVVCPKCKKNESFGVLSIHNRSYTRRCKECWFTESYKLPELKKKVIYLDQFVISEIMKAVNDKLGKKEKIDKLYFKLFETLEELSRAQLIICPDSTFHKHESLLSNYYSALKQMYEHLSGGATFFDPQTLRRFQITECFRMFLQGKKYVFNKKGEGVMSRDINGWRDKFRISVDFKITDEEIENIRDSRLMIHKSISELFESLKLQKNKKFSDWTREEEWAYGKTIVSQYISSVYKQTSSNVPIEELISSITKEPNILFTSLFSMIKSNSFEEKFKIVTSFLTSEKLLTLPFNRLSALMWACIEYSSAQGGRTNPPNIGMVNDIEMVSTLLPYCDAMFVDNDIFNILNRKEIREEINKYKTKIFSKRNQNEFFNYLNDIKKVVDKDHFKKVVEVYGESWNIPYWEMYKT